MKTFCKSTRENKNDRIVFNNPKAYFYDHDWFYADYASENLIAWSKEQEKLRHKIPLLYINICQLEASDNEKNI